MATNRASFTISQSISQSAVRSMARSVSKGLNTEVAKALRKLERELSNNEDLRNRLAEMNAKLASEANGVTLTAYRGAGFNSKPYRGEDTGNNKRYPGAMEDAISAGLFFNTSSDGALVFLNEAELRKFAPHWRRLNYGAGAKGASSRKPTIRPMRFGRGVGRRSPGFKFALRDRTPSPGFSMPRGVWSSSFLSQTPTSGADLRLPSGANDAFYPGPFSRSVRGGRPTAGIAGAGFLDRGLDYVNQEYPKRVTDLALQNMRADIKKSGGK